MTDRSRLALLDASHSGESTRRNFRRELDADLLELDAHDTLPPVDEVDIDGIVVTGSASSVYWDEPWIDALVEWVRAAVEDRGLPALGVCFGHQTLATALGGRVEHMGEYEIGYREVRREGGHSDPVLGDLDDRFLAFTTHQDAVVELPPGAERIAANDYGVQGFRLGLAWGVQFHPEYDLDTAERIAEQKRDHELLTDEAVDEVLAGVTAESYDRACRAKRLFDSFVAVVREERAAREQTA
ncbi:MAG: GMP synthase - glutamine amidotransferase domain protein [uncultured archaeon A07HB70]|nr:MAG: GMP synthase - glutamine amidotransferase domain protein [uncultured archaeon A07HB70]